MLDRTDEMLVVLQGAFEQLLGLSYGTDAFNIQLGVGVVVLLLFGRLCNGLLGGSSRGFILTFLGLVLPILVGLAAFSFVRVYGSDYLQDIELLRNASLGAGVFFGLFTLLLITPFFLGIGFIKTLLVALISYVVMVGAAYYSEQAINIYWNGKKVQEQRYLNSEDFN